jgi:hypothetical protein
MPWFTYKCTSCNHRVKVILDERLPEIKCDAYDLMSDGPCGQPMKPVLKAANVKVVEQLDNGAMVRKVERIHNIEEILQERSDKFSVQQEEGDDE